LKSTLESVKSSLYRRFFFSRCVRPLVDGLAFTDLRGDATTARQNQAHPLCWTDIKEFIESAGEGLRADRERAMLCVAYETLALRGRARGVEDSGY
jgi:hypothetical protein